MRNTWRHRLLSPEVNSIPIQVDMDHAQLECYGLVAAVAPSQCGIHPRSGSLHAPG